MNMTQLSGAWRITACPWLWVALLTLASGLPLKAQIAPGSALNLNGNNGYALVTLGETLTSYTISAWVYLRSGGQLSNPRVGIVSATTQTNCGITTEFLVRGTNSSSDEQYLELARCGQFEGAVSTTPVPLNTWVQVGVSVTNQPSHTTISFFINGVPAGTTLLSFGHDTRLGPNVMFGCNDGTNRKFDGYLDEVQIWRNDVPPITNHVLNGAEGDLLAYYRFDEGAGNSSGNIAYLNGASAATLQGPVTWTQIPARPAPPGSPVVGGDWVPEGPRPLKDSYTITGVLIPPDYVTVGNVYAAAVHPTDTNIIYLAGPTGGIWKTINAGSSNISWVPLTDHEASLSMGCIEFDPTDATHQTLVAGFGNFSSSGSGARLLGLLRTTDGGVNWQRLSPPILTNVPISSVVARGNIILASAHRQSESAGLTDRGLYRSTDGGNTFTNLAGAGKPLPAGGVDIIAPVPGNLNRCYASSPHHGIFRSDDQGATWINVSSGIANPVTGCGANTIRVFLAVHNTNGTEVVYAAVANKYPSDTVRNTRTYAYFSTNSGASWVSLGPVVVWPNRIPPKYLRATGFLSLGAHPTNPYLAYVGGSYADWGGEIVRIDRSGSNSTFTSLVAPAPNYVWPNYVPPNPNEGRTPHTDSHGIIFDAAGNLIEVDDGGINLLPVLDAVVGTNGLGPQGGWRSLSGNLQLGEFYSIAYDPLSKVLIGGSQDQGTPEQRPNRSNSWKMVLGGDGGDVAVDARSGTNQSTRYASDPAIDGYETMVKRVYDRNGELLALAYPALQVLAGPAITKYGSAIEVNVIDPLRLLIGGTATAVYESTDQGETMRSVGSFYAVSAARMVYGGYANGVANPDVIWAVGQKDPWPGYYSILFRTNASVPAQILGVLTNDPGVGIVADSDNWREAYYITTNNVLHTPDAGQSWTAITANLAGGPRLRSIEFLPLASGDALAVGTDDGVYITRLGNLPRWWRRLGSGLPRVIVWDLRYDPSDQLLVVGTLGRGAWSYSMVDWPDTEGPGAALNLGQTPLTNFVHASISPPLSNNYTISAWINLRTGGAFPSPRVAIVSSTNCGGSVEFLVLGATTNTSGPQYLQFARCNAFGPPLSTGTVPLHQWAYVAVTVGPTLGSGGAVSNLVSYYINGQPGGSYHLVNANLSLGPDLALGWNNNLNRKFDGHLDQVRIWAIAISPAQIALTMTAQSTGIPSVDNALVMSLNFDEGTGGTVQALAGTTASIVGPFTWAPSRALFHTVTSPTTEPARDITSSSASLAARFVANTVPAWSELYFDYGQTTNYGLSVPSLIAPRFTPVLNGNGDFIASGQNVSSPQTFSVGLWFKTTFQSGGRLIGFGSTQTNASPQLDRHLYLGTDGVVRFGVFGDTYRVINGGPACNDGRWHHAMGTFSTNGMRLYVDGVLVAGNSTINPGGGNLAFHYGSGGYWRLGWDSMANWPYASANSYFGGAIADAQVWDIELSPAQVAAGIVCPLTGNESGLITYYRLDEGGGSIIADSASAGGQNLAFLFGTLVWVDALDFPQCYRQTINNLEPASTYHFRAAGANAAGVGYSADRAFATLAPSLRAAFADGEVQISWRLPATGFVLQGSTDVGNPSGWQTVSAPFDSDGATIVYHIPPLPNQSVSYRLHRP